MPTIDAAHGTPSRERRAPLAVCLTLLALAACQSSPFEGPSRVPPNPDEGTGLGPGAFSDPMVDRELVDDNEPNEDPLIGEPVEP